MPRFNPHLPAVTRPCYKLVMRAKGLNNQLVMNTFYYIQNEVATTVPNLTVLHSSLQAAVLAALRPIQSIDTQYIDGTLYRLDEPTALPTILITNVTGNVAGDSLPASQCFRLDRRVAFAGQRAKGVLRVGLVPESATIGDKVAAAFEPTLDAAVAALIAPVATANPTDGQFVPALIKRTFTPGPVVVPIIEGLPLNDWDWSEVIGTQRTRLMRAPN